MNDEIKEILSLLNSSSWSNETKQIEDYITNLQQENEIRQQDINNLTYQLAKMKEENDVLKKKLDRRYYKNEYERNKGGKSE